MALAVTAIIGRVVFLCSLLIFCVVSYPSISGIIISISTMSISGLSVRMFMASCPLSAVMVWMLYFSNAVVNANRFRTSSSTTSTFLLASTSFFERRFSINFLFSGRSSLWFKWSSITTSSSKRSSELTSLSRIRLACCFNLILSLGAKSLAE